MTTRTSLTTVTFVFPFSLADIDGVQPAGTYTVETEEEQLLGLSFLAYRRVATRITLPWLVGGRSSRQFVTIDPIHLAAALDKDGAQCRAGSPAKSFHA